MTSRLVRSTGPLAPDVREQVVALAVRATLADGTPPLSEQFRLGVAAGPLVSHLVALDQDSGAAVGYAQVDAPHAQRPAAELVVDPGRRRAGIGTLLLNALPAATHVWAHGDVPAATAFAGARGLTVVRELHRMVLDLAAATLPALPAVPGLLLRPFEPGRDEDEWLRVNARAFASHPEQGALTRTDLGLRMAEPWFEPAGLLLLVPEGAPDRIAAFHWTKIADPGRADGEVYVVGVDPAYQGHGLGRAATLAGLHHLRERGVRHVGLYVDGDNAPALGTYRSLGFSADGTDRMFRRDGADTVVRNP
ncbi:MAG TPA: mycothiol synthase [Candidatus Lustribacter sp.]|nr:mycothiol synthase [Candidatus Lustribacter sp.]